VISCNGLQQYKRSVGMGLLCNFCLNFFSPAALSDLEKDLATIENGNKEPANDNEQERVEKRGKSYVWHSSQNRLIEVLLQVQTRVQVDAGDRRRQKLREDIGCDSVRSKDKEWLE